MRNGDAIKSSEKFIIKHDGLLIKNVQESDDGIYTCRAAGKFYTIMLYNLSFLIFFDLNKFSNSNGRVG